MLFFCCVENLEKELATGRTNFNTSMLEWVGENYLCVNCLRLKRGIREKKLFMADSPCI